MATPTARSMSAGREPHISESRDLWQYFLLLNTFPGLFRPSCTAWLTTEGLVRCGIVCYATRLYPRWLSDSQTLHTTA